MGTLLVMLGSTYLSRLWCVCEIFVFLQMGGSVDAITVMSLEDSGKCFADFDVRDCNCFRETDKEALLDMIEYSYPSGVDEFNDHVLESLKEAMQADRTVSNVKSKLLKMASSLSNLSQ